MRRIQVRRDTWDLEELAERWGLKRDEARRDMRRLIASGEIEPFKMVLDTLQRIQIVDERAVRVGAPSEYCGNVWVAQEYAIKTGNFEYAYPLLRDRPRRESDPVYFELPTPCALSDVFGSFVVSDANVQTFEASQGFGAEDRSPSKRQERTQDVILLALYYDAYSRLPDDPRCTGVTDIVKAADAIGLKVSVPSVREHLRAATKRLAPGLERQLASRLGMRNGGDALVSSEDIVR